VTGPISLAAAGLLAFCVLAEVIQQMSFKTGASRAADHGRLNAGILVQPLIWLGVAIWAVEIIAWTVVLEHTPLSLAYPVMTLSYAAIPLASFVLLRERMSRRQRIGAALVAAGVLCVGISGL